jgi:hypothetical protein
MGLSKSCIRCYTLYQLLFILSIMTNFFICPENIVFLFVNIVLFVFKVKTKDLGGYATTKQFTNAVISNLRTPAAQN